MVASMNFVFPFSVVSQVLVGLRKHFINNYVFPAWAGATGFNNNNNNIVLGVQQYDIFLLEFNKMILFLEFNN